MGTVHVNDNSVFTFDKKDWLLRCFVHNDRADKMLHFRDGMHAVLDESGKEVGQWDDVGHFGCIEEATLFCPINEELDDQLIEAYLECV